MLKDFHRLSCQNFTVKHLSVQGKVVLDIGANIGDTAIYFAINGAKHVISIEPYPYSYEAEMKNIESNNVSNRVTLLLVSCSSSEGQITIDPKYESYGGSKLTPFEVE